MFLQKLDTVKRGLTVKRAIPISKHLHICVLQAVMFPVLDAPNPRSLTEIPKTTTSISKDGTIYVPISSMEQFRRNLSVRLNIMVLISTMEAQIFTSVGSKYLQIDKLETTDLRGLIDQLALLICSYLRERSRSTSISPALFDTYLIKGLELFLALLKEAIQTSEKSSHEILKSQLFQIQNLSNVYSKYLTVNADSNMALIVRDVFGTTTQEHYKTLHEIALLHSESHVVIHLTAHIKTLAENTMNGYQMHDFRSKLAYSDFLSAERNRIESLIRVYELNNQELDKNAIYNKDNLPSDSRTSEKYFKALLSLCYDRDLLHYPGTVTLSKQSRSVLNECALSWRLNQDFKNIAILEAIIKKSDVGRFGILEGLPIVKIVMKLTKNGDRLRLSDHDYLYNTLKRLRISLIAHMQTFLGLVHDEQNEPINCDKEVRITANLITDLEQDRNIKLSRTTEALELELFEEIKKAAVIRKDQLLTDACHSYAGSDQQIQLKVSVIHSMHTDLQLYKVYYPSTILSNKTVYEAAALSYLECLKPLLQSIEDSVDSDVQMLHILDLYDNVHLFYAFCMTIGVIDAIQDIETYFLPIIDSWLFRTDSKWKEWVGRAYELDKEQGFKALSSPSNLSSSSVIDLFSAFQGGLTFVTKFRFQSLEQEEQLKRRFIATMYKSLESYCKLLFNDFKLNMARSHIIKYNNLMQAQILLESLLHQLDSTRKLPSQPIENTTETSNDSFEIKVVGARHLPYLETYCVISLDGKAVATTEVSEKNNHPFWYQDFIINLPSNLNTASKAFLHITIYSVDDIQCGKCAIFLRNEDIQTSVSQDIVLSLRPQGALTVRIRKRGEVQDSDWYINRSLELLKFTAEDMVRFFTSKVVHIVKDAILMIVETTQGRKVLGVVITPSKDVTFSEVELLMVEAMKEIDQILTLLNQNLDRRFDATLEKVSESSKQSHVSVSDAINPTLSRELKGIEHEAEIDYRLAPYIVRLIWNDILNYCQSLKDSIGTKIEDDKRLCQVITGVVECVKSLLFCEGKGMQLKHLNSLQYSHLRTWLNRITNE